MDADLIDLQKKAQDAAQRAVEIMQQFGTESD